MNARDSCIGLLLFKYIDLLEFHILFQFVSLAVNTNFDMILLSIGYSRHTEGLKARDLDENYK